ncbi:hypothetical protein BGZ83_010148 [Gryganskiella cystojenkinii]|nr:hypothetical protein BGZ83_010148 [Gryganskiella cystojenkinii]
MPLKKAHLLAAVIFFMVVLLSRQNKSYLSLRNGNTYKEDNVNPLHPNPGYKKEQKQEQQKPYRPPYGSDRDTNKPALNIPKPDNDSKQQPTLVAGPSGTESSADWVPNTSDRVDTLIVIPSSWTQIQNRKWVRETLFGIKDNLEPCRLSSSSAGERGKILYKFYVHGQAAWAKTSKHSAEYMQSLVRELYGELVEFEDLVATNTTTPVIAVWGDALAWAVDTFIPNEKITVDKILIFDSTAIVNLAKMEKAAQSITDTTAAGWIHTWGWSKITRGIDPKLLTATLTRTTVTYAAMFPYMTLQHLLEHKKEILERYPTLDLVSAAAKIYNVASESSATIKVVSDEGEFWRSDIDAISGSLTVVGSVHQSDDWFPIAAKMEIQPITAHCNQNPDRSKRIAVMTSSFVYVDMCMAEASLPSAENKRLYASLHGYDFVARGAEFAQEEQRQRRIVWGKIGGIQKVLPHYEWLFWMDMDAVVVDLNKDLREIIQKAQNQRSVLGGLLAEEEISLIVAKPTKDIMLNAGVMLIKNTDWSKRFFNEVQKRKYYNNYSPSYEQAAIWEVMREPEWSSGVEMFDKDEHTMNTFPDFYEPGDFIVHLAPAGCPAVPILETLKRIKNGQSVLGVGYSSKKQAAVDKAAAAAAAK